MGDDCTPERCDCMVAQGACKRSETAPWDEMRDKKCTPEWVCLTSMQYSCTLNSRVQNLMCTL